MPKQKAPLRRKAKKRKKRSELQKRKDNPRSSYWRSRADKAWATLQYILWDHKCAVCGEGGRLEAHHLVPRNVVSLRHCVRNGIVLCPTHHKWNPYLSAHGGPAGFADWLQKHHPEQFAWAVAARAKPGTKPDYKAVYEQLTTILLGQTGRGQQ